MEQIIQNVFDNQTFIIVLSIILGLYSALLAPALPNNVIMFFDSIIGKLIFLFLIAFMASKNIQVALMMSVAFVVTLTIANKNEIEESFESFTDNDESDSESEDIDSESEDIENEQVDMKDNQYVKKEELFDVKEEFENCSVQPAHNLSGSEKDLYAPY